MRRFNNQLDIEFDLLHKAYRRICLVMVLWLVFQAVTLKAQTSQGVSIGGVKTPPDESAMLDIISSNKGLLIPRTDYEAMLKITPVSDGLMVFVKDAGVKKGFWYWSSLAQGWVQLQREDNTKEIKTPVGTVVMYCGGFKDEKGKLLFDNNGKGTDDTKMQGWHLCNGMDGTPDMRGRFVMGANPVEGIGRGSSTASNFIKLDENNMPEHNHGGDLKKGNATVSEHKHEVTETVHTHSINHITKSGTGNKNKELEMGKGHDRDRVTESTSIESAIAEGENRLQAVPKAGSTEITFPVDFIQKTGGEQPIDNRPSYFVVAFIVKMN